MVKAVKLVREEQVDVSDELKRLLEIGRLLASVLTPEEAESLRILLSQTQAEVKQISYFQRNQKIGNTGVT